MNRRSFITATAATVVQTAIAAKADQGDRKSIRAIAFDGLALFDPRPVFSIVGRLTPDRSAAFIAQWRNKLFEYTWLRTLVGNYTDFLQVADDALMFAVNAERVSISDEHRRQVKAEFMNLKAWPDVAPALRALKQRGLRLVPLNDFTVPMLEAGIKNSGLMGLFEDLLSTDRVKAYKPDPRAYQMGVDALGLRREEIAFAAFAGWDAAGAKSFGYPTIWVNRLAAPMEQLTVRPDVQVPDFEGLLQFIHSHSHA